MLLLAARPFLPAGWNRGGGNSSTTVCSLRRPRGVTNPLCQMEKQPQHHIAKMAPPPVTRTSQQECKNVELLSRCISKLKRFGMVRIVYCNTHFRVVLKSTGVEAQWVDQLRTAAARSAALQPAARAARAVCIALMGCGRGGGSGGRGG